MDCVGLMSSAQYFLQEEVAQENQQKIKEETQTVHKAKKKLDKHQKMAEDTECKYSSVRERIDQLSEEMELLKVQYHMAVSRRSVTKNSFRNQKIIVEMHQAAGAGTFLCFWCYVCHLLVSLFDLWGFF